MIAKPVRYAHGGVITDAVVIEAIQWNGKNVNEVQAFIGGRAKLIDRRIRIRTLEGAIYAAEQDWIIKGVQDECYPCKPDIFEATYDKVENEDEQT